MKLSLVIEGGGLRGSFAIGALAELANLLPVRPAHVYATSSGAPNAAYFTTGQLREGLRIWEERTHGDQLVDYRKLLGSSPVLKVDELVDVFRRDIRLDVGALARSPSRLHIAVTEAESGDLEVLDANPDNIFELLAAAMAMPFAYGKMVSLGGRRYFDGGFRAPVAIREALAKAPDKIIVILTKPRGHRRKQRYISEWLQCRSFPNHENARDAIRSKWRHYNQTMELLDDLESSGQIAIVRPRGELPAGRLSRSRQRIVDSIGLGKVTVKDRARELMAYLRR